MKNKFALKSGCSLLCMIHIHALPGTPGYQGNFNQVLDQAIKEASILKDHKIDGIIIENMHDIPYLKGKVGPEISTSMAIIGKEIKKESNLPVGIQILAGANKEAMGAALSAGLDFIRAEGFVFAHVADEGIIESCAGELLRYRKMIEAEHIAVWTDIKKKHSSHAITQDVGLGETAHAAEFFNSDAVIITGTETGKEASLTDIGEVRKHSKLPIVIGSGITALNIDKYKPISDALIVGSWFKKDGFWKNDPDIDRIKLLVENFHK